MGISTLVFFLVSDSNTFAFIDSISTIVIFGPGETKKRFANHIQKLQKYKIQVVDGIDSGGEDGIYTFTKSQTMHEIMSDSKLAKAAAIIDEIMILANKKSSNWLFRCQ